MHIYKGSGRSFIGDGSCHGNKPALFDFEPRGYRVDKCKKLAHVPDVS
jgi:hypothetical protein